MLDAATTGFFPAIAEVGSMAKAHVFKAFRQKAKRNLHNAAIFHGFFAVPFIRKQSVDDLIAALFQRCNSTFTGLHDFLFGFARHWLR